jgi:hypothetical protein
VGISEREEVNMKRTYIKRSKTSRKKLREKIGKLHLEILKLKRGERDELTGKPSNRLGRFHILPVGNYPRIEFHDMNVLLTNWFGSHFDWHHDFYKAREIEKKIKKLRGEDYETTLKTLDKIHPKMSMFRLNLIYVAFQREYENLKNPKVRKGLYKRKS